MTSPGSPVTVIGAGIVGLCCARWLQRDGHAVTVIDPVSPGESCSFGNAGILSKYSVVPLVMPGILAKVPGWLLDPQGPLVVRWRYLPRAMPWLLRLLAASRRSRVAVIADALAALNAPTLDAYGDLLGAADFADLTSAAKAYLAATSPARPPRVAAFAVACPVTGDGIRLTNSPWSFSATDARRRLGLDSLHVINDFEAIAWSVPRLGAGDVRKIGGGRARRHSPIAVIGPGTGLGVSALVPSAKGWRALATEGGHVTLAPVNDISDLTGFQHLEERGYWLPAPLPNGTEARTPGLVARLSETPMSVRRWAPALGEHNRQVLNTMLGLSDDEINLAAGGKAG